MNRLQIIGAIKFPAFLLIWSAGLVLFMGQLYPADAALIRHTDQEWLASGAAPLPAIPSVEDYRALGESLEVALELSDLDSGRWHPGVSGRPIKVSQPVAEANAAKPDLEPGPEPDLEPDLEHVVVAVTRAQAVQAETVEVATAGRYSKRPRIVQEQDDPDPVADTKRAARLVLKSSRPEQAYALLMGDVSRARGDVEFLGLLAVAALQRQLFAEAQVVYRKLVEIDSKNDRWWAGLALTEKRLGLSSKGSFDEVLKLADEGSRLRQLAVDELRQT